MKRLLLVGIVVLACVPAWSADTGIKTVTNAIEARYGVRHQGVPLVWLGGLKMAVFEEFRGNDPASLDAVIRESLGAGWSLFVEVRSHHERTNIFVRPEHDKMLMLITTLEKGELTLIQLKCSGKDLHGWFSEPVRSARDGNYGGEQHSEAKKKSAPPAEGQPKSKNPV